MMKRVRLGIIGVGGMGSFHARAFRERKIRRCDLVAVCDIDPGALEKFDDTVQKFVNSAELIRSGACNAVLVATPHYGHTIIGADALEQGLHVLVEKPISVHKADCERLIAAHKRKSQVFAAMFNQRTDPHYKKVKLLIDSGKLGALVRVSWIVTSWFRTDAYYASGGWRATWAGEGGGVLLNQSPHQLDLLQWLCGMPRKVCGFCAFGRRHKIEVEDEVTAYLEYPNGATGVFITSTGEAPGTNRLEIAGDLGRVVVERDRILFTRNKVSASKFCRTSDAPFASPDVSTVEVKANGTGGQHVEVLQNFVDAILDDVPLIAPARDGSRSVEIANAILYSSLLGRTVDLPLDGRAFELELKKLVAKSGKKRLARRRSPATQDVAVAFRGTQK
ncbi:MAG: Gfo/Idh/MocA family oxidoreductase [bacterium]